MIDENKVYHISVYNGEIEEFEIVEMTLAEMLDRYSEEGCPINGEYLDDRPL